MANKLELVSLGGICHFYNHNVNIIPNLQSLDIKVLCSTYFFIYLNSKTVTLLWILDPLLNPPKF